MESHQTDIHHHALDYCQYPHIDDAGNHFYLDAGAIADQ
jgi:hypothetical protein